MAIEVIEGQGKIIGVGFVLTLIISAVTYIVYNIHISSGVFAGFVLSLINYYLLNITIEKGARLSKKPYQFITVISFFVRFSVLAYLVYLGLLNFGSQFIFASLLGMLILKGIFFISYMKTLFSKSDKKS